VIAVEKGVKTKVNQQVDALYKVFKKPALFDGFTKTYKKDREDDGEDLPPQIQKVQYVADQVAGDVARLLTQLFDVEAQKDLANMKAAANIEIDGLSLGPFPVTYLLFLEKILTDMHTIMGHAPTLDPAEEWSRDPARGLHMTKPTMTARTKKVQKALVLLAPTEKHPGQAVQITEDQVVGKYEQIKLTGAWPEARKRQVVERVEELLAAIKYAREQANVIEAPEVKVGKKVFDWILAE